MMSHARKPGHRLLHCGYSTILSVVVGTRGGASWHTVHTRMGIDPLRTQRILAWMAEFGLIHVAAWEPRKMPSQRHTVVAPIFKAGPGANAPHPGYLRSDATPRQFFKPAGRVPVELLTFANAVEALKNDEHNGATLADEVGMARNTASKLLRHMHHVDRLIYVSSYQRRDDGGHGYPLFSFGPGKKDAVKPPPMSKEALWERHNLKHKSRRQQARLLGLRSVRRAVNAMSECDVECTYGP